MLQDCFSTPKYCGFGRGREPRRGHPFFQSKVLVGFGIRQSMHSLSQAAQFVFFSRTQLDLQTGGPIAHKPQLDKWVVFLV